MPFCPECRVEYREGFATCSDCDVALVAELPVEESEEAELREQLTDEVPVEVFVAENGMEAEIVLGILESAGIRAYLTPHIAQYVVGMRANVDRMQQQAIYVLESQADEARSIIHAAMAAGTEIDAPEEY